MIAQFSMELNSRLVKAAGVDLDIMDLWAVSADAADQVHNLIGDVQRTANRRFRNLTKGIPEHLRNAANDFIYAKGEEIEKVRRVRAIIGARRQRFMREARLNKEAQSAI